MQQWRKTFLSFRQLAGCGLQSLPANTLNFKPQTGGEPGSPGATPVCDWSQQVKRTCDLKRDEYGWNLLWRLYPRLFPLNNCAVFPFETQATDTLRLLSERQP